MEPATVARSSARKGCARRATNDHLCRCCSRITASAGFAVLFLFVAEPLHTIPATRRGDRLAAAVGSGVIVILIGVMSGWVGSDGTPVTFEAFQTLLTGFWRPLLWLGAAIGLGWPLRHWLARNASHPAALQTALGVALMLVLDATLGALGWLTSSAIAWCVTVAGVGLLLTQMIRVREVVMDRVLPDVCAWACAPAVAVLLIAVCSAPGWLWSSEFGGYDGLSYHLQLPKEWMALGRIQPLEHNVYSFLPGYVEAAYLHVMALHGGPAHSIDPVTDCQLLHAMLTIISAALTGTLAARFTGRTLGALAAALYLVTPWTIVVGSLAYNEMPVNLMLAAGLIAVFDDRLSSPRRGVIVGLLSAAATGAKLTSLGFVAVPLGLALLLRISPRKWLSSFALAALAGAVGLLPWLLRNWAYCSNPLFPFATNILGAAHWTAEQTQAWHRGHMPDATLTQRFSALWHQFLAYGFGRNPRLGEPWQPQWSILPLLGIAGGLVGLTRSPSRRPAAILLLALAAQIAFWLAFTHLQSRFLLPAAVPLSVLAAIGLARLLSLELDAARPAPLWFGALAALAVLGLSILPVCVYRGEHPELGHAPALAVGLLSQQTGESLTETERLEFGSKNLPAIAVNWLLPPGSKVLLVGEAAALYYRLDRIVYCTVWDRGPLSQVMREHGSDPEAMRESLRALGFTHVLVNPTMLSIWERDKWNDPLLTRRSVQGFLESAGEPLFDYSRPSEITIYAVPP